MRFSRFLVVFEVAVEYFPTACTVPLNAHQNPKTPKNSNLLYTIKMDPINAALAALEL